MMNTAELKLKIFREIDRLDKGNLEEVYGVILNYLSSKDDMDEWENLTAAQQDGIIDSISELEENQGISHGEVIKKYKKKYNA